MNANDKFEIDYFYHVYNRANGNEVLFKNDDNYNFFLKKYKAFITPYFDTYCYCLMPNHFHFLVKPLNDKSAFLSKNFSNLFNSYAQAFNKQQSRKGNLFMRPFKRKRILDVNYLQNVVIYIHQNPVKAGLSQKNEDWIFSSYYAITSNNASLVKREETISWFDDIDNFKFLHSIKNSFEAEFE